jgi:hypothetical protein
MFSKDLGGLEVPYQGAGFKAFHCCARPIVVKTAHAEFSLPVKTHNAGTGRESIPATASSK